MTQKVQDIDDLKGRLGQDIDDPRLVVSVCDTLRCYKQRGGVRWNKSSERSAIERYLKGESPKSIYTRTLKRSKNWFFKWLKRYKKA